METYNLALITKKIYDSGLNLFTLKALNDILEIKKESTGFKIINSLVKNKVLVKIERSKYYLAGGQFDDFTLANFIYEPSYISFETALNLLGILSQFPYEITSATVKKTKKKIIEGKLYSFTRIQKNLFWGYEKKNNSLIALPEKALLDQIYLASKGLKGVSFDEYDYSFINKKRFKIYLSRYPKSRQFSKKIAILKKYFEI